MKKMMRLKWLVIGSCLLALTACSSGRKPLDDVAAIDAANAAYVDNDAKTAGLGEDETTFGDHSSSADAGYDRGKELARRVYYFDFDSNQIHSDDKPAIIANADKISGRSNVKVLLEGHTDPRGSREYNIGLGERRAKSIAEFLMARGVSPKQLRIVSYGAEKPAVGGHDEGAYRKDRRVVLVYLQQ